MIRMANTPFECNEPEAVLEQMSETCMLAVGHAAMTDIPGLYGVLDGEAARGGQMRERGERGG